MESKFQVQDLLPIGLTIVVLGIGLAYGLQVTGDVRDDVGQTVCSNNADGYTIYNTSSKYCHNLSGESVVPGAAEFNATGDTITGVAKLPAKLPTIVGIIVAAVIIGILVRYMLRA